MPLVFGMVLAVCSCTTTTRPGAVGVERQQLLLVSAFDVERMATLHYAQQYNKAKTAGRLITSGPEYDRLRMIGEKLIRQTPVFRDDTKQWKWHLTLIDAPILNATCAPGGKITFYTGLIRQLSLDNNEIAAIMGHEIAHALREHGREKVSEAVAQKLISDIALASTKNEEQKIAYANKMATYLFVLPNSREKESEADKVGLELAARAGFDPRAAVNVWRKMASATRGQEPPKFLSTHPSHAARIAEISALLPVVMPIYQASVRQ